MKKMIIMIPTAALLICCTSSRKGQSSNGGTVANIGLNKTKSSDNLSTTGNYSGDSVIVTGSQYIPIAGRSETGTRADLEGAWELDSLNGMHIVGTSTLSPELLVKKAAEGSEIRRDSTSSTQTIDGVTRTTTTILIDKSSTVGNKITPPQGGNFHIPAKPSINFYGSNETFSGFTGCNKFSGRYSISEKNKISLQSTAASTRMVCLGKYDEDVFLKTLKRVNQFKSSNSQLELLEGDKKLLVFSKKRQ